MSALQVCYKNGYTLAQLASAFNLSIMEVCQQLPFPVKLDRSAADEINAEHFDLPVANIADVYNTRVDLVYKALKGQVPKSVKKASRQDIIDAIALHGSEEVAALKLGISVKTLHKRAEVPVKRHSSYPDPAEVKAFNGTQQEAAEHFNVSRAWICKHAGSGKTKNSKPGKIKDWEAVMSYLESNSLAATARKFGVSSSSIIQWKNRNGL